MCLVGHVGVVNELLTDKQKRTTMCTMYAELSRRCLF